MKGTGQCDGTEFDTVPEQKACSQGYQRNLAPLFTGHSYLSLPIIFLRYTSLWYKFLWMLPDSSKKFIETLDYCESTLQGMWEITKYNGSNLR